MTDQKEKLYNELMAREKIYDNLKQKEPLAKKIFDDINYEYTELYFKLKIIEEKKEKAEEIYDDINNEFECAEDEMSYAQERIDGYIQGCCLSEHLIYPYIHNSIEKTEKIINGLQEINHE